jgi:hypothetical protein
MQGATVYDSQQENHVFTADVESWQAVRGVSGAGSMHRSPVGMF